MKTLEYLIENKPDFEKLQNNFKKEDIEEIMEEIKDIIIDAFNNNNKYTLTHEYDPPYDCSGYLKNENELFNIKDYKNVGDFLQEYTGNSTATYYSGCGLIYNRYEEVISEESENLLIEKCKKMVYEEMDMDEEEIEELSFDFFSEFDHDFYDNFVFPILYEKIYAEIEKLKEINFKKFINS